jgi:DNA invertase Pin-like site-specific DNA recombinase
MKKKVIAYARVSTTEQSLNQNALKQQISRLKAEHIDEILFDVESGTSNHRENFTRLLKLVEAGQVEKIVATRWDRLMREESLYIELKKLLQKNEVKLYLLDQGTADLESASGLLSADINVLLAIHESRMLRERVQKGHEYRRKNKEAWSRSPFGYTREDKQYVLNNRQIVCILAERPENYQDLSVETDPGLLPGISKCQIAREAVDLFLAKRKNRIVLRELYEKYGVPRKSNTNLVLSDELLLWGLGSSLKDWLKNPVLRGHTAYMKSKKKGGQKPEDQWEMYYDTHVNQRLISDEEYDEILSILAANAKQVGTPGATFYLTGLVYCQECGTRCVLKRGPHRYYGCRNVGIGCSNRKNVRLEKLDEAVRGALFKRANTGLDTSQSGDLEGAESQAILELKTQLEGLEGLLNIAPNLTLQQAHHDLAKQIQQKSNPNRVLAFDKATAKELIQHPQTRDLAFWYTLTDDDRSIVYNKLVDCITIQAGQVTAVKLHV